jgi:hypothetical protein
VTLSVGHVTAGANFMQQPPHLRLPFTIGPDEPKERDGRRSKCSRFIIKISPTRSHWRVVHSKNVSLSFSKRAESWPSISLACDIHVTSQLPVRRPYSQYLTRGFHSMCSALSPPIHIKTSSSPTPAACF